MNDVFLLRSAWALIGLGLVSLVVIIPWSGNWQWLKNTEAKTEFFSARAAYWCVVLGLVLLVIIVAGRQLENMIAILKGN